MKKIFVLGLSTVLALSAVTSCNDDDTPEPVRLPEKEVAPENGGNSGAYISDLELTTYSPLKSYLDRAAYPNFKLTAAIEAADFNGNTNGTKDICLENFDEIVAGNAMKYASCVNAKGEMKFDDVKSFVSAAKDGGLSVFGHTLAWHSQQQPTYLNGLLYEEPNIEKVGLVSKYPGSWYQYFVADQFSSNYNAYKVVVEIKCAKPGSIDATMGWGWGDGESATQKLNFEGTGDWETITIHYSEIPNKSLNVVFKPGTYEETFYVRSVKVYAKIDENSYTDILNSGYDFTKVNAFPYYVMGYTPEYNPVPQSIELIPLPDEEQKANLTEAMDSWIKGMMEATDGYVKAWDVVNEPIAGEGNDGEGNYPLQHSENGNDDATSVKNGVFYWQDVLGDIDYVRTAVKSAREHFKGKAEDLKLFVNDYNLESDWDDNKKLKSLINWVKKWEADNVTRIDGLGTQMHISCYEDDATNDRKKAHIKAMFELMAATGKLVRISELDMGYVDKDDKKVATKNVTAAQHAKMAELYKFIVKTYLETIPAAQQYGICQWCLTDAPGELGTGWRGGEPVGLWTEKFEKRKATYAGFADGLSGK